MSTPDWRSKAAEHAYVIGADECGWGAWAGPLVVCAVAVPSNWSPPTKLTDSKALRKTQHEELYYLLRDIVSGWVIEKAQADEIDRDGAGVALKRCFRSVVQQMKEKFPNSLIILDGEVKLADFEHLNFPEADGLVPAVSAASVLGKYLHDEEMRKLAETYPGYDFAGNCGYHAPKHVAGIAKKGLSPIHRRSYVPTEKQKTVEQIAANPDEGMAVDDS